MTQRTKLVLGIIGAAAAGVAIGMLLAPEKGTDVRRNITRTAGGWATTVGDLFANAKGQLTTAATKARTHGSRMANQAEDYL